MTDPKKFFNENMKLLPSPISSAPRELQREYNLNAGLLALTTQLAQIQADQNSLKQELHRIEQIVRGIR